MVPTLEGLLESVFTLISNNAPHPVCRLRSSCLHCLFSVLSVSDKYNISHRSGEVINVLDNVERNLNTAADEDMQDAIDAIRDLASSSSA